MPDETTYDLKVETADKIVTHERPLGTTGMEESVKSFEGDIAARGGPDESAKGIATGLDTELTFMENFTRSLVREQIVRPTDLRELKTSIEDKINARAQAMDGGDFYRAFVSDIGLKAEKIDPRNLQTLPQMAYAHDVLQGIVEGNDKIGISLAEKYKGLRQRVGKAIAGEVQGAGTEASAPGVRYLERSPEVVQAETVVDGNLYRQLDSVNVTKDGESVQRARQMSKTKRGQDTLGRMETQRGFEIEEKTTHYKDGTTTVTKHSSLDGTEVGAGTFSIHTKSDQMFPSESNSFNINEIILGTHERVDFQARLTTQEHPIGGHHEENVETYTVRRPSGPWREERGLRTTDQEEITIEVNRITGEIGAKSRTRTDGIASQGDRNIFYTDWSRKKASESKDFPANEAGELLGRARGAVGKALEELRKNPEFRFVEQPKLFDLGTSGQSGEEFANVERRLENVPFVAVEVLNNMGA